MPQFVAIPVTQGDAFYLERGDLSVLVDGGRNGRKFPGMFREITHADGVDVAVCTHNDADHTNGILGFLEADLRCGEVWLPGRWLAALRDVLKPFFELFVELADNVAKTDAVPDTKVHRHGKTPIEAYADTLGDLSNEHAIEDDGLSVEELVWPDSYRHMLERAIPWEGAPGVQSWPSKDWPFYPNRDYRRLGPPRVKLLWSAIEAASRIRAIAIEAFLRDITVRWFEFHTAWPPGGRTSLIPLNSREITKVPPSRGRLLDLLALTVSNRESLVFWSPPTDQHPGVLFNADSDLKGVSLPSGLLNAIATAPHHGSEANKNAYLAIPKDVISSITWVRSDGKYPSRPGSTYRTLSSQRLCTRCRVGTRIWSSQQAVKLFARGAVWARYQNTATCSCE